MKDSFSKAVANITKHGDTDVFPLPIDNIILFDNHKDTVAILIDFNTHFDARLASHPPSHYSSLVPVGYTGFRLVAQLDPIWNALFLGLVISIADRIEDARVPTTANKVFSYRYKWSPEGADLWAPDFNWRSFMEHSMKLAATSAYVVACDISEFYPRLNHHRLENALKHLHVPGDQPAKIMKFLSNFSGTYSFGLPVGGPAARLLSELVLNQIDHLLRAAGVQFCRFSDDYHIFADSYPEAVKSVLLLSQLLIKNQGLQLQKSKTRIMTGAEFLATNPLRDPRARDADDEVPLPFAEQSRSLLRLSLRFDPYSPTRHEDYESLRTELEKYDILGILRAELSKSRIHVALAKKIVQAVKFIDESKRGDAIASLVKSEELLYPVYSNVLTSARVLFESLNTETAKFVVSHVEKLVRNRSYVMQADINLIAAIRLLGLSRGDLVVDTLASVYSATQSAAVKRDIILAMAKLGSWYWLSDLRNSFMTFSSQERRAFIIASYALSDEGKHWREHIDPELSPFERLVKRWAAERVARPGWSVPL